MTRCLRLLERENALLSENAELWEKVFMAADKGMTMQEDGKNYGDFLLDTVEAAKEQFTDKEYAWLKESATEQDLVSFSYHSMDM